MGIPREGTYKLNVARLVFSKGTEGMIGWSDFTVGDRAGQKSNDHALDIDVTFDGDKISFTMPNGKKYVVDPDCIAVNAREPGLIFVQDLTNKTWWAFSIASLGLIKPGTVFTYESPVGSKDPIMDRTPLGAWHINGGYPEYINDRDTSHVDFGAPACFLPGTLIETENGAKPVELIRPGDHVMTLWGRYRQSMPVIWVGSQKVRVHPDLSPDMAGYPVIIRANAIDDCIPKRDLHVTSEHCIALDNHLIPVRMLVNNHSIFYDKSTEFYTVYHFETAKHAVVMAEGLAVETFLNTGNRGRFDKYTSLMRVSEKYPATMPQPALPIGMGVSEMKRLWLRIARRASDKVVDSDINFGFQASQRAPRFKISAEGGTTYRLKQVAPNVFAVKLPASEKKIAFESPSFRFCDIHGPYHDDRRRLELLIEGIDITTRVKKSGKTRDVSFHLGDGWLGHSASWPCWTNGHAELLLDPPEHGGRMDMVIRVNVDVLQTD